MQVAFLASKGSHAFFINSHKGTHTREQKARELERDIGRDRAKKGEFALVKARKLRPELRGRQESSKGARFWKDPRSIREVSDDELELEPRYGPLPFRSSSQTRNREDTLPKTEPPVELYILSSCVALVLVWR